jgi:hypothetical protein
MRRKLAPVLRFHAAGNQVPGWGTATRPLLIVLVPALALALGRLLPESGIGLALRLGAASVLILVVPGALVVRACGRPRQLGVAISAAFLWSLVVVGVGLAAAFAAKGSIELALVVVASLSLGALCLRPRPSSGFAATDRRAALGSAAGGAVLAAVVWWSTGTIGGSAGATDGDALFHLARVRKLVELPSLSLRALDEFRDGGLHPGYAFPLWHGAVALVVQLAGVDSARAFLFLPAVLTPLVLVVSYGAGQALLGSWAGGVATATAGVAVVAGSRGDVGALQFLAQPGAVARLLVVPALLALLFAFSTEGDRRLLPAAAAGSLALTLMHPTYLAYVLLLSASFACTRFLLSSEGRPPALRAGAVIAVMLAPAALALTWLAPLAREAAAFSPAAAETRRALARYSNEVAAAGTQYSLQPRFLAWGGAATVAALLAIPCAALAYRRAWAAYVLGATAALGSVAVVPLFFTHFADVMSLSQALRIGSFLPLAFALAGAAELVAITGAAAPVVALAAGIAASQLYPEVTSGPAWAVWLAIGGTFTALLLGVAGRLPRITRPVEERWVVTAAVAFLLPIATTGLTHLHRSDRPDPFALTPGLVHALDTHVRQRDVVFSNVETSYRITAAAPVYVAASLPGHVARTSANRPYQRQWDTVRFFFRPAVSDAVRWSILRSYGADWVVVDSRQRFTGFSDRLQLVYRDARYRLYRVPSAPGDR